MCRFKLTLQQKMSCYMQILVFNTKKPSSRSANQLFGTRCVVATSFQTCNRLKICLLFLDLRIITKRNVFVESLYNGQFGINTYKVDAKKYILSVVFYLIFNSVSVVFTVCIYLKYRKICAIPFFVSLCFTDSLLTNFYR